MDNSDINPPRLVRVELSEDEEFQALALYSWCLRQSSEATDFQEAFTLRGREEVPGLSGVAMTKILEIGADPNSRFLLYIAKNAESGDPTIALDTSVDKCSQSLDFDFLRTIAKMP